MSLNVLVLGYIRSDVILTLVLNLVCGVHDTRVGSGLRCCSTVTQHETIRARESATLLVSHLRLFLLLLQTLHLLLFLHISHSSSLVCIEKLCQGDIGCFFHYLMSPPEVEGYFISS